MNTSWPTLTEAVFACEKCRLCQTRTNVVLGEGDLHAPLMFIGEGPGQQEDETGRPFVGAAGHLLDRMLAAIGLRREQVYICNIVKCRPPQNRVPEADERAACMDYLRQQVALSSLQLVHGQQRVVLLRLIPSPRAHFGAELVRFRCEFFDARLHRVQVLARAQLLLDGVQRLLRVAHLSLTSRRHTHLLTQLGSLDVDAHQGLLGALVDAVLLAALLHEGIDAGRGLLQILLLLRHAAHYDIITQLHALEVGNGLAVVIDLLAKRRVVFVDGLCVMARMSTPP